jgi:glutathione peroxidase
MNTHDFSVRAADDSTQDLRDYAGRVLLIVNVASKCGLTPQYQGLETLHRDAKDGGLQILGFPCKQFGGQEPGTDADIQQFCSTSYDVTFPVFGKIDVNGPDADPYTPTSVPRCLAHAGTDPGRTRRCARRLSASYPSNFAGRIRP